MDARDGGEDLVMPLIKELIFSVHGSRCRLSQMIGAVTLVAFVMLAAVLIVAVGPVVGLAAWLLCLAIFRFTLKRLRRRVWGQSRFNQ
jgi:uncharacterized membrane protein